MRHIAKLEISMTEDAVMPDHFVWLGNGWGDNVMDRKLRTAQHFFVTDMSLVCRDVPTTRDGRAFGVRFHSGGHVLAKGCDMRGYRASLTGYISE